MIVNQRVLKVTKDAADAHFLLNDMPVKVDPNAPPGMIFILNDKYMEFSVLDARTRWQRIKDWFKHKFTKGRPGFSN